MFRNDHHNHLDVLYRKYLEEIQVGEDTSHAPLVQPLTKERDCALSHSFVAACQMFPEAHLVLGRARRSGWVHQFSAASTAVAAATVPILNTRP